MSNTSVFANIQKGLEGFEEEFLGIFLDRVRLRTPVKTGQLRDGWEGEVGQAEITVQNTVPHAAPVEYGTWKMEPRRMLATTVLEAEQIAVEAARKAGLDVR